MFSHPSGLDDSGNIQIIQLLLFDLHPNTTAIGPTNPNISQDFVVACPPSGGREWKVLLRGCELVKRRSSRIDILQSGVLSIRAVAVALSALAAGIL